MRTVAEIRSTCAALPGSTETFPFDASTLVFKVMGKVFALTDIQAEPLTLSLKCEPQRAERLRAEHGGVTPGYHLNKRHWNTLTLDGQLPDDLVADLVRHSYERVVAGLTRAERAELALK